MRRALQFGLLVAGAVGCSGAEFFVCNGDEDCAAGGEGGICQPTGSCSFPDESCPSGQRYGSEGRPALAGECVQEFGSTGSVSTGTTSTGAPGSSDSSGTSSSIASSSSEGGDASTTTGGGCPADWWDCAYATRHRLSLTRDVGAELTSVPVLVLLDPDRVDYAGMQNDGEDIRFVSATGEPLPFEIGTFASGGTSRAWVSVDALGGEADHLWLYYGNPVAQTPVEGGQTWPDPFVGVWSLDGDGSDATDYGNDATPSGSLAFTTGQVGGAADYPANDAQLNAPASESLADLFHTGATASAWVFIRGWGGSNFGRIADKFNNDIGWRFYVGQDGRLRFSQGWAAMESRTWTTPTGALELETWTHVAVVYDASADAPAQLYINGVEAPQDSPPTPPMGEPATDADRAVTIGNRPDDTRRFDGLIDEFRLARTARSAEWIAVQYDAMRDALLEYGPAQQW